MSQKYDYDVIVVGAGVVGPAIATAMSRAGRKVLLVERSWKRPERIVGELLQPAGVKALVELGMAQAINNIEAIPCEGYWIKFFDKVIKLDYLTKLEAYEANPIRPVPDCVHNDNDKIISDDTIDSKSWYNDDLVRGASFHNGDFLMNLRQIAKNESNITPLEGVVTDLLYDQLDSDIVNGVTVKLHNGTKEFTASLVISCDGIFSKLRKTINQSAPSVESYFIGLELVNCEFPQLKFGHVILGQHAPVLAYQTSNTTARMLCAFRSNKLPSLKSIREYLSNDVLPSIPEEMKKSLQSAIDSGKYKPMPNQYLSAVKQKKKGFILLGDSLNMRHPLTGGGMTVGLNDAVLLARLLHPSQVPDLSHHKTVIQQLRKFHSLRKRLDAVINTLSIALYALFAAESKPLKILQYGCFAYFERGGDCVTGPIGLLSGMLPFPMLLFNHFFSVAFYGIFLNFKDRGLVGFPVALFEFFWTIYTAVVVFVPYLWSELLS